MAWDAIDADGVANVGGSTGGGDGMAGSRVSAMTGAATFASGGTGISLVAASGGAVVPAGTDAAG